MLKVYIERSLYELAGSASAYFDYMLDDKYIETDFSKRVVKEIDKSELVNRNYVLSPVLGSISTKNISGGAKILICTMYTDKIYRASSFGDNCFPILADICREKDVILLMDVSFTPFRAGFDKVYFIDSDKTVYTDMDFIKEFARLGGHKRYD